MSESHKAGPPDRLEAILARILKHRQSHWQLYAAVTGSAMAIATNAGAADTIPSLVAAQPAITLPDASAQAVTTPTITIVAPNDGSGKVIQPGEWVSIYGSNLATATGVWNGSFPT
jgi:phage tail protein X